MSSKILEGGIPRRDLEKQQQSQNCEGKKLYYTTSLRSISGENSGRKRDRSKHPLRGSLRFSDGKSCVCTPFCFLDERGEEIPIIFENAFEVVRAFCSKIKRKKTTTERGKGWVHIFWKMSSYARGECAQPLHKRIGADDVTSENRATNTVTVFLIEKITKRKKEKKKKELVPGIHLEALSFEIVQPSSEMESDSALLESETQI